MRAKLGLLRQLDGDADLVRGLTAAMQASGADFADVFRGLSRVPIVQPERAASGSGAAN